MRPQLTAKLGDGDPSALSGVQRPHGKTPLSAWWMLTVLVVLYVLSILDRFIFPMLAESIKKDLKLTDLELGLLLGPAFAICFAVSGLPLGWAVDRFSRRWVVFGGVMTWTLATTLSGLARTFGGLFAGRLTIGVGEAALNPAAYSLIADKFPRERMTTAIAIYNTGAKIGSAVAFGIGGLALAFAGTLSHISWPVVGHLEPWNLALIMLGAPGILIGLLVFTFADPPRRGTAGKVRGKSDLLGFMRTNWKLVSLLFAGFALVSLCSSATTSWVPAYMERRFHWEPIKYGPTLSLINLIAASVMVLKGGIIDWLYKRGMKDAHMRFYLWLLMVGLPIIWVLFFIDNAVLFLILYGAFSLVGIGYVLYIASTFALIAPNEVRGQLSGLYLSVFMIAGPGVGPLLVGAVNTLVFKDEQALGLSLAVVSITCMTLAFLLLRPTLKGIRESVARMEALETATG